MWWVSLQLLTSIFIVDLGMEVGMEAFGKVIRGLCSIPLVGGVIALLIGILPFFLILPFPDGPYKYLLNALGGILVAGWCYFLSKKKIINIVTPLLPVPFWVLGILMAIAGVYQHIFGPISA